MQRPLKNVEILRGETQFIGKGWWDCWEYRNFAEWQWHNSWNVRS